MEEIAQGARVTARTDERGLRFPIVARMIGPDPERVDYVIVRVEVDPNEAYAVDELVSVRESRVAAVGIDE